MTLLEAQANRFMNSEPSTDTLVRLQIWDTAGQERFRSISRLYYRGANACLVCYDVTSEKSFFEMGRWLSELRRELGTACIIHVVGTKSDLVTDGKRDREVPFERCIAYVAENLYPKMGSTPPPTATPQMVNEQFAVRPQTMGGGLNGGKGLSTSEGGDAQGMSKSLGATGFFDAVAARNSSSRGVGRIAEDGEATGGVRRGRGDRNDKSKRSSGFWGQDVGWDCCHEISAESGEGVEEVFRVVTRKLVEQARRQEEGGSTPGAGSNGVRTPRLEDRDDYFVGANSRGSFRIGRDRMSWLGFPTPVFARGGGKDGEQSLDEAIAREFQERADKKKGGKCC